MRRWKLLSELAVWQPATAFCDPVRRSLLGAKARQTKTNSVRKGC
jgi:hypothetical protein